MSIESMTTTPMPAQRGRPSGPHVDAARAVAEDLFGPTDERSFEIRYWDLVPSTAVIASAESEGFEARDVESLREHYVTTLRHWVHRLDDHADEARALVGDVTYRVWRLYMAASAYGFRTGRIGVVQTLLAKPTADGDAHLPRTRADIYAGKRNDGI